MSEPIDVTSVGIGGATSGALLLWAFQRFFRRADKDGEEIRATLGRIESRLNDIHLEQRLQAGRITALEKTVEHVQERINGGLLDHRLKLEGLTERVVRVETRMEDDE